MTSSRWTWPLRLLRLSLVATFGGIWWRTTIWLGLQPGHGPLWGDIIVGFLFTCGALTGLAILILTLLWAWFGEFNT